MNEYDLDAELQRVKAYVGALEARIQQLEHQQHLPSTSLLSPNFLTRAFAVFGHYLVASLIIVVPIYILMFIIIFAVGGMSGF